MILRSGVGRGADGDRCAYQESRHLRGLPADTDALVPGDSEVCRALVLALNDAPGPHGERFRVQFADPALLLALADTDGDEGREKRRVDYLTTLHMREWLPELLDAAAADLDAAKIEHDLRERAAELRALDPIIDDAGARRAWGSANRARASADRARDSASCAWYSADRVWGSANRAWASADRARDSAARAKASAERAWYSADRVWGSAERAWDGAEHAWDSAYRTCANRAWASAERAWDSANLDAAALLRAVIAIA